MQGSERLTAALPARAPDELPGLVPYVTCGFPSIGDTPDVLTALQEAGCVAAEIGIPFSDPLADGPTIQRAGLTALRNGASTGVAIEHAATARDRGVTIPLVLMSYVNPILSHGVVRFCAEAAAAGVTGVIVPDLPDDEAGEIRAAATGHGLALVPLLAPTSTDERVARAAAGASGFVYCVSVTGVTGARAAIAPEAFDLLERVRQVSPLPRALGFGLARREHLEALRGRCEAAVVGSALVNAMAERPTHPAAAAAAFVRTMVEPG